jgi:hypothetical protein
MALTRTPEQVKEMQSNRVSPLKKPIRFINEIQALSKGAGLFITDEEWDLKSSVSSYYNTNINKDKKNKVVSCRRGKDSETQKSGTMVKKL